MSTNTADFTAPTMAPATASLVVARIVRSGLDWIPRRRAIHMHRSTLHRLPHYVLADIGISRDMIDSVVPERLDHAGRPAGPYPF
jgi:uncharacterized protein YjiS (DUF1127 family)